MIVNASEWASSAFNKNAPQHPVKRLEEDVEAQEGRHIVMLDPGAILKGVMKSQNVYETEEASTAQCTPDTSSSSVGAAHMPMAAPKLHATPICCPLPALALNLGGLAAALTASSFLAIYLYRRLGIGLIGVMTNVFLITYMTWRYRRSVLIRQGLSTFLEALCVMAPIVILENAWWYGVVRMLKLPAAHGELCGPCVVSSILDAYTSAAFFEEVVKYIALRHLMEASHVMHPMALVAYGAWAGSAFEVLESLLYYDFNSTLPAAVFRSVTPLHALTGMIMGATLAKYRFSSDRRASDERWYWTLLVPMALHGTYDLLDFLLPLSDATPFLCLGLVIGGYLYLRHVVNHHLLREQPMEMDVRTFATNRSGASRSLLLRGASKPSDEEAEGFDAPTYKYIVALVFLTALATQISFLSVNALLPPAYDVYTWRAWGKAFFGL